MTTMQKTTELDKIIIGLGAKFCRIQNHFASYISVRFNEPQSGELNVTLIQRAKYFCIQQNLAHIIFIAKNIRDRKIQNAVLRTTRYRKTRIT